MTIEGEDRPSNAREAMHLISNVFIWYGFMDNGGTIERVVLVVTREVYYLMSKKVVTLWLHGNNNRQL